MRHIGTLFVAVAAVITVVLGIARATSARPDESRLVKARQIAETNSRVTREYLAIVDRALIDIEGNRGDVGKAVDEDVFGVDDRCRGIALAAPANTTRLRVEAGITEDLATAAAHANLTIANEYRRRAERLRWPDEGITRRVDASARAVDEQAELANPPICAVIREWVVRQFGIPPQLANFSQRFEALSERGVLVPPPLERYVARDFGTLRDIRRLEGLGGLYLRSELLKARAEILRTLGLVKAKAARPGAGPYGHRHGASAGSIPATSSNK